METLPPWPYLTSQTPRRCPRRSNGACLGMQLSRVVSRAPKRCRCPFWQLVWGPRCDGWSRSEEKRARLRTSDRHCVPAAGHSLGCFAETALLNGRICISSCRCCGNRNGRVRYKVWVDCSRDQGPPGWWHCFRIVWGRVSAHGQESTECLWNADRRC